MGVRNTNSEEDGADPRPALGAFPSEAHRQARPLTIVRETSLRASILQACDPRSFVRWIVTATSITRNEDSLHLRQNKPL